MDNGERSTELLHKKKRIGRIKYYRGLIKYLNNPPEGPPVQVTKGVLPFSKRARRNLEKLGITKKLLRNKRATKKFLK